MESIRVSAIARSVWGAALLLDAPSMLTRFGYRPTPGAVALARLLGGRDVVQGAVTAAAPTRPVVLAGAAVDTLHAMTALGLAAADPRWRRVALADAAAAGAMAVTGWQLGSRSRSAAG